MNALSNHLLDIHCSSESSELQQSDRIASPREADVRVEIVEMPVPVAVQSSRVDSTTLKPSHACSNGSKQFDQFEDHYELGELIGEGGFGSVYRCTHKTTGTERAVKIIQKQGLSDDEKQDIIQEHQIVKELNHSDIVRMVKLYDTSTAFFMVQEIVRGCECFDALVQQERFTEEQAALIIRKLLSCLAYLDEHNLVHRDVNLENILLGQDTEGNIDYSQVKLIDFGLCAEIKGEKLTHICGKSHYLAPEVMEQRYDTKYDVWSLGCVAYVMLAGFMPFDADTDADVRQQIMDSKTYLSFEDLEWDVVSEDGQNFVASLLTFDADARPSAQEALQHPWLNRGSVAHEERIAKETTLISKETHVTFDDINVVMEYSAPSCCSQDLILSCDFNSSGLTERTVEDDRSCSSSLQHHLIQSPPSTVI